MTEVQMVKSLLVLDKVAKRTDKPGSVLDGHLSTDAVAGAL